MVLASPSPSSNMEEYAVEDYGHPNKHRRVGEEYQAELPPILMSQSDYIKQHEITMGLRIPLFCIKDDKARNVIPDPESSNDTGWNEIEVESFTLGLHIFRKNLVQVKRFIGNNKTMREILVFYYTNFYNSEKYLRWCKYRKMKLNIFTGQSLQELVSRLLSNVKVQFCSKLLEVSKAFMKKKKDMPLEKYVSTLKTLVGLPRLIEAVGIGKENDLTSLPTNTMKSSLAIPSSKDFTKLTSTEVMHYVTGGFRLLRSRESDLFWEAVWPRLLARGWNSKQLDSKLIFIIPGVEEFSRKLRKGIHYFDSISDVLAKVAADPWIIEYEIVADNNAQHLARLDSDDSSPPSYLSPGPSTPNMISTNTNTDSVTIAPSTNVITCVQGNEVSSDIFGKGAIVLEEVNPKRKRDYPNQETSQAKKCNTLIDPSTSSGTNSETKDQHEEPRPRFVFDLNLPLLPELEEFDPMDNDTGDPDSVDVVSTHQNLSTKQSEEEPRAP